MISTDIFSFKKIISIDFYSFVNLIVFEILSHPPLRHPVIFYFVFALFAKYKGIVCNNIAP
jgi:hypothetical protein